MVAKEVSVTVKTKKYFQIWLIPRFSIMSEKYRTYRPLKHQKRLKAS